MNTPHELYLSWVNDFLTVKAFAEHYGMSEQEATELIERERAKQNKIGAQQPESFEVSPGRVNRGGCY